MAPWPWSWLWAPEASSIMPFTAHSYSSMAPVKARLASRKFRLRRQIGAFRRQIFLAAHHTQGVFPVCRSFVGPIGRKFGLCRLIGRLLLEHILI